MKSCLFFFTILSGIALGSSFLAEEAAIRLNLPGLAKQTLLQHTLDAFPQGGKCHLLLAQIYYLEKNFPIMRSHLQRTNSDLENYYLNVLSNWFIEKKLNLIPLLLCAQEHPLGEFLADCNQILLEPLNSPQWAQFLGRQSKCYSLKTFHSLYSMLIEMKFSIDPGIVHTNLDKDNWEIIVPYLFAQRRFEKLEHELQQLLIKMPVSRERLRCFLWFIQVKQKQLKNCDEDVLSFLNTIENDTEAIDFILSEWLSLFSQEQQLDILKRFHKIYSKKHLKFQSDYLELLRIQLLLETGKLSVAEKLLHKNLNRFDTHLKSLAYELAAKLASLKNPVSYRQVADFLQEASKFSKTLPQTINYMQLEAQCYCLEKDYQRAYALYQEAFFKAISHEPAAKELAYEWCLCGILCDETLEDLNQQLAFCHANNCLALRQEQELKLTFFQHLLEQKRYKEIKKF